MTDIQVKYSAPPTLARMMRSDAIVRCAVGPRGSGKSSASIMEIIRRSFQQQPFNGKRRTRWAVIRNTYRELKDTTRPTFEKWMPAALGKNGKGWRESDFAFDLHAPLDDGTTVESEIIFRSLDKPGDAKKVLSLELTGGYVNELKEIPKGILIDLKGSIGRFPAMDEGGATWRGIWADTNPWAVTHWGYKLFKKAPTGFELFKQPGGRSAEAENLANLRSGYYDDLALGAEEEWIKAFVDGEYPDAEGGAIWAALIERLDRSGAMGNFDHAHDGLYTSWDLGFTDSTAIWFWRLNSEGGLDFVDHYESHGQPLSHYFDMIEARGWSYAQHWLPHDAAAHTLAASVSVEDQFRAKYPGKVQIGPSLSLLDGIQAARWLLEQPCRFHPRTAEGIEALRSYHYEWDDEAKTYSKKPEHDWSSHSSDSFRYAACVAKHVMRLNRKPTPKPSPDIGGTDKRWSLDQLFADNEAQKRREKI